MNEKVNALILIEQANLANWNCGFSASAEITPKGRVFNKKIYCWKGSCSDLAKEIRHIQQYNYKRLFLVADEKAVADMKPAFVVECSFPTMAKGTGRNLLIHNLSKFADKTWVWMENSTDCGMLIAYKFQPEEAAEVKEKLRKNLAEANLKAEVREAFVFFSGK